MRQLFTGITCLSFLITVSTSQAQERVRNVRIRAIDSSQLEIQYDLVNARPGDSVYVDILSRVRGSLRISPEFVRGDVGTRITAGSNKRIVWNAVGNGYPLNEEVQARVLVKAGVPSAATQSTSTEPAVVLRPAKPSTKSTPKESPPTPPLLPVVSATKPKKNQPAKPSVFAADSPPLNPAPAVTSAPTPAAQPKIVPESPATASARADSLSPRKGRYVGPAWALVSAVAPGIGNIFVQTPKSKIGLRPLVTVGCYGLLVYGLMERQKAQDQYAIYEQQKNMAAGEPYYKTANDHHHAYFMATRGAVVVAAADVILTFIRGLRNSQLQKEARRNQSLTISPSLQAGQPTALVRYSF